MDARRRRVGPALFLSVGVAATIAVGAGWAVPSVAGSAGTATGIATVLRRDLVATDTEAGVIHTISRRPVVTVNLPATAWREAIVGDSVPVQLAAGNTVTGRVTSVSPVRRHATVSVSITLTRAVRGTGLGPATVSVNFPEARATNVLSVPVTALLAMSGSTYAVQEPASPHLLIPVTPGLIAAGYVQISGLWIYPGLQVTVPR